MLSVLSSTPNVESCLQKNYKTVNDMKPKNIECILTSGRTISDLPSSTNPFLIIKYGPTGSGKGSEVVQKEIRMLGVPLEDYAVFEIDRLVESITLYRTQTMNIKNKRNKNKITNGTMYRNLTNAYFGTRKAKNNEDKNLNTKMDDILMVALHRKTNIIFETTGTNFSHSNPIKWLIDQALVQKYRIIVIYPIVSTAELVKRVVKRANNQSAQNKPKPFYRAVNTSKMEEQSSHAMMNLTHFLLPELFAKRIYKIIAVWNE